MRRSLLLMLGAMCFTTGMFAQTLLKNDGATLVIESGATLVVEGGIENINSATLTNNGTLEVQGNFVNSATFSGSDASIVRFSGATSTNVTSGTGVFDNVEMEKGSNQTITLTDDMTISGDLTFDNDNNRINIGANDLIFQNDATVASYDGNEYIVTGDVGYVRKEGLSATETFVFPVGFNSSTYNPATIAAQAGHANDVMSVRAIEHMYTDGLAETEQATEQVADVMWDITEGAGGGSNYHLTLQWATADQLPDFPAQVGISRHDGSNWDMLFTQIGAPSGTNPWTRTRNNVTAVGAFAVGGEPVGHELAVSMKVFLQGGYVSGQHRDSLRFNNLIPTAEPYAGTPYSYTHVGFGGGEDAAASVFTVTGANAIADWILLELRDNSNPTTILASRSALIQRDGDIVDVDGTSPVVFHGLADGNYHIAIKHRNHLGIRTASAQALTGTPLVYNFTTGIGQAYDNPDPLIENDAMANLGGGVFGMWGGDANRNNNTRYNGTANDKNAVLTAVGTGTQNNIILDTYNVNDVNMNGQVGYNGAANDKNAILTIVGTGTQNAVIAGHLQ